MAKSHVRLPLSDGTILLLKHSCVQMVSQPSQCDPAKECFVHSTNRKKSYFKVAMSLDKVEELLG